MYLKDLELFYQNIKKASRALRSDGGINYLIEYHANEIDVNRLCELAHKRLGSRGLELGTMNEATIKEFKEEIALFFNSSTGKVALDNELIGLFNISLDTYSVYMCDLDYSGYGGALIYAIKHESGVIIIASDWTLD